MLLVWKDSFAIDNGPIDRDHQVLVKRINDVLRRLSRKPRAQDVLPDLNALRMHADFHFRREERIQAAAHYPGLDEHAAEHRELLGRIDAMLTEVESLAPDAFVPDYKTKKALLYRWIIHHLIDTDMKMKPHLERVAERVAIAEKLKVRVG